MMIKIQNTLTGKKDNFNPLAGKKVGMFVCGPTVFDYSHIGHARTYVFFDAFAKFLKHSGYAVRYIQNVTDIDDKIINRAKEAGKQPLALAKEFEAEHLRDMKALKINSIFKYIRATDNIPAIISQIKRLLEKRFAYRAEDGIYFDISKFKTYGKLAGRTALQAEDATSRIDSGVSKKNKGDFCLWKFSKPDEPEWPSPFGAGRPGWHIEDTAITEKYFGSQYDLHGGGRDLIFPHHEAEIAQMEAISGKKPMAKYWLHVGFVTVKGQKMSKSLGNFLTIRGFLEKYGSARILRYFCLKNHYRSPVDFEQKMIGQASKELAKIDDFISRLKTVKIGAEKKFSQNLEKKIQTALENDFNMPEALATLFSFISNINEAVEKSDISKSEAKKILAALKKIDSIFGFIFWKEKLEIPEEILNLAKNRQQMRNEKKWGESDQLRQEIESHGYYIEDTDKGFKIKSQKPM